MRPCELIHTVNHIINLVSNALAHVLNVLQPSRGYALFVPLGDGERPFGFTPTFTEQRYYIKKPPQET